MRCLLVFFFFCAMLPGALWAERPIEVYVNGTRYASIDAYKASKKAPVPHTIVLQKGPEALTPQTRRALESISMERGIGRVMADFDQNWDNPLPKFKIDADELAGRLESLMADRTEPVLVVAEPDKIRVAVQDK